MEWKKGERMGMIFGLSLAVGLSTYVIYKYLTYKPPLLLSLKEKINGVEYPIQYRSLREVANDSKQNGKIILMILSNHPSSFPDSFCKYFSSHKPYFYSNFVINFIEKKGHLRNIFLKLLRNFDQGNFIKITKDISIFAFAPNFEQLLFFDNFSEDEFQTIKEKVEFIHNETFDYPDLNHNNNNDNSDDFYDPDNEDKRIREEQEEEYLKCLEEDKMKLAKELKEKEDKEKEELYQRTRNENRKMIVLPEEPKEGDPRALKIAIQLPSGDRLYRRFSKSDFISDLYNFVMKSYEVEGKFVLASNFPKVVYSNKELTLEQSLLPSNTLLYISLL